MGKLTAEQRVDKMLKNARVPKHSWYRPGQVQKILNISDRTFRRLCDEFEPPEIPGRKRGRLESYYVLDTHRRVDHEALIDFIEETNSYNRMAAEA